MKTAKQLYTDFISKDEAAPIFIKPWWLNAVKEKSEWDAIVVKNGDQPVLFFPYFYKPGFVKAIHMPKFTPYLGPYIIYPEEQTYYNRLSYEKKLIGQLLDQLPPFHKFNMATAPLLQNWLPFYWRGFNQTTRYTYRLQVEQENIVFRNIKESIRRQVKKASKRVEVSVCDDPLQFFELNKKTFSRQGNETPYSRELFLKFDKACESNRTRKILLAKEGDTMHAALYLVCDSRNTYYLLGGSDPRYRNSGAGSLLMWEAIRWSFEEGRVFDFEGSMLEPVEQYFRSFGARQVPYFQIRSYRGLMGTVLKCLHAI